MVKRVMQAMVMEGHQKNCVQKDVGVRFGRARVVMVGAPVRHGASQLEWQHPAVAEVRC